MNENIVDVGTRGAVGLLFGEGIPRDGQVKGFAVQTADGGVGVGDSLGLFAEVDLTADQLAPDQVILPQKLPPPRLLVGQIQT